MDSADSEIKTPEDLSRKCALSFLEELFYVNKLFLYIIIV